MRTRYPREDLAEDLYAAFARDAPPPPPGRDPPREVVTALVERVGDDRAFKRALKTALGGKKKGRSP